MAREIEAAAEQDGIPVAYTVRGLLRDGLAARHGGRRG